MQPIKKIGWGDGVSKWGREQDSWGDRPKTDDLKPAEKKLWEDSLPKEDLLEPADKEFHAISRAISRVVDDIFQSQKIIMKYCKAIIDRAVSNDYTLEPDDVLKANKICRFTQESYLIMRLSIGAAHDILAKGTGIISQQTADNLDTIFLMRATQVKLFAAKLEVFHKQEKDELEHIFHFQELQLEKQQDSLNQLKEIIKENLELKEPANKQNFASRKVMFEEKISISAQQLKEEVSRNEMEIAQAQHKMEIAQAQHEIEKVKRLVDHNYGRKCTCHLHADKKAAQERHPCFEKHMHLKPSLTAEPHCSVM